MLTSVTLNYEFIFWELHGTFPVLNTAELKFELSSRRRAIAWWSISLVTIFFSWFMFVCLVFFPAHLYFWGFCTFAYKKRRVIGKRAKVVGWIIQIKVLKERSCVYEIYKGVHHTRVIYDFNLLNHFPHKSSQPSKCLSIHCNWKLLPIFCNVWQKLINMKSMSTYIVRY
jgi:hypothetical protein